MCWTSTRPPTDDVLVWMSARVAADGDGLRQPGDLQIEVRVDRLADADLKPLLLNRGKSLQLHLDVVRADRKRREAVQPFGVADRASAETGLRVRRRHRGAGDCGSLRIQYASGDRPGGLLRASEWRQSPEKDEPERTTGSAL